MNSDLLAKDKERAVALLQALIRSNSPSNIHVVSTPAAPIGSPTKRS